MTANNKKRIGVLAIQGDYARHQQQLDQLGVEAAEVRLATDLNGLDGLIIPGGESTTMDIMLDRHNLREPLTQFGRSLPLFGTCAGMIMLATGIEENLSNITPLALLDIDVNRNGYGRQVHSFDTALTAELAGTETKLTGTFIRAPKITRVGDQVEILAKCAGDPVLVRQGNLLAASFHSELDDDPSLLAYFLNEVH